MTVPHGVGWGGGSEEGGSWSTVFDSLTKSLFTMGKGDPSATVTPAAKIEVSWVSKRLHKLVSGCF